MPVTDMIILFLRSYKKVHKLNRFVQSLNFYFMYVRRVTCNSITTIFSHAQTAVVCGNCGTVLCMPTGGKCKLTEGCDFRQK